MCALVMYVKQDLIVIVEAMVITWNIFGEEPL